MAATIQSRHGGRGMITGINVTPLVDIVLVLLIIMMVTSTYIVAHTLKVELPKTASSDGPGEDPSVLTLLASGEVQWNGQGVPENELAARLKERAAKGSDVELVISADAKVEHGRVVKFIDLAKVAGISRFAINVERKQR